MNESAHFANGTSSLLFGTLRRDASGFKELEEKSPRQRRWRA